MKAIRKDPSDFTMVTRGYWSDLRALSKRMPAAFQVLILITERMNKSNALVISQATLGQMLGYGRTTIHKATKLLEDEKWLQVVKVGTANAYIVNSKVVWRDHSGKRYGSFYAEVLVSEEEQHKTAEQLESVELRNIPVLLQGEKPILSGLPPPPPDQGELLPPDPVEFPRHGIQAELAHYTDPLPQALVLTAIVIAFAMTAVTVVLAIRSRGDNDSDHVDGSKAEREFLASEQRRHEEARDAAKADEAEPRA